MKQLRWLLITVVFTGCMYYGLHLNVQGALNVALTIAGVVIVVSFLLTHTGIAQAAIGVMIEGDVELSVPPWFDIIVDIGITLAFIWYGYIVVGVLYFIHIWLSRSFHSKLVEAKNAVQEG